MNMIKKLTALKDQVSLIFFNYSWNYFKQGYQIGQLKSYISLYFRLAYDSFRQFGITIGIKSHLDDFYAPNLGQLARYTQGLHQLLSKEKDFSYSILIAVTSTSLFLFKKTLLSALQQSAPQLEVLVGYNQFLDFSLEKFLQEQKALHPFLRLIPLKSCKESDMLNDLAHQAQFNWLVCIGAKDWIRPDYLFRCEQLLRLLPSSLNCCLYTKETVFHESGISLHDEESFQQGVVNFPYSFQNLIGRSILIRREKWLEVKGLKLNPSYDGFWEMSWRLYLQGASFHLLPFPLYKRCQENNLLPQEEEKLLLSCLNLHTQTMNLNWTWTKGRLSRTYRAIPPLLPLNQLPTVQVIIPYKNQKEITLKAVKTALNQKGVKVFITAVDNNSEDLTIAKEIEEQGGEVLRIEEPFNYSRLNNLAVEKTKLAKNCDYLLFLNNDVELDLEALKEMCRWINQPSIGWVGCQLFYPNGLLQHGGVDLMLNRPFYHMLWNHSEKLRVDSKRSLTQVLRIAHAVTAACALISRQTFLEIGGFDEIWYPIAYSDTNLAVKLQSKGLLSFYSPYAQGIHHESISRSYENIEDVENSTWLHEHYLSKHQLKFSNYLSLQSISPFAINEKNK